MMKVRRKQPSRQTRSMADGEFVELLREMGEADPGVTIYEFTRAVGCSFSVIYRRFGSWPALRERAGLPAVGRRGMRRIYTADDIHEAFRRAVAEVGPRITLAEFTEHSGICHTTVKRHVGGWNQLRALEGLEPNRKGQPRVGAETIREAFRAAIEEHGKELTLTAFCEMTGFSEAVILRRCGGWRALRESESVPENKPQQPVIPDERIREEYARIQHVLKRKPTFRELGLLSYYGEDTFRKRLALFKWQGIFRKVLEKKIAERQAELAAEAAAEGIGEPPAAPVDVNDGRAARRRPRSTPSRPRVGRRVA